MIKCAIFGLLLQLSCFVGAETIELNFKDLQKIKFENTERGLTMSQGYGSTFVKKTACTAHAIKQYWDFLKLQATGRTPARARFGEVIVDGRQLPIAFGTKQFRQLRQAESGFMGVKLLELANCSGRMPAGEVSYSESSPSTSPDTLKDSIEWAEKLKNPSFKRSIDSCINQICIVNADIPSLSEQEDQLYKNAKPLRDEFDQKIAAEINSLLAKGYAARAKDLKSLRQQLDDPDSLSLETKFRIGALVAEEVRGDYTCKADIKIDDQTYCAPTVNRFKTATADNRQMMGAPSLVSAALSDNDEKKVMSILEFNEMDEIKNGGDAKWFSLSQVSEDKMPGPEETRKIVQAAASHYLSVLNSLEKNGQSPSQSSKYVDRPFLERMKAGNNISLDDFSRLFEIGGSLSHFAYLKTNPNAKKAMTDLADIVLSNPATRAALVKAIQNNLANLKKNVDIENMAVGYGSCQNSYALQMAGAPTDNELKIGAQTAVRAQQNVVDGLRTKLSSHSMSVIAEMFKKVKFAFPPSKTEVNAKYHATMKEIETGDADALVELCSSESGRGGIVEDRASLLTEEIQVSQQSLRFPEFGREVLSHELGHKISGAFQRGELSAKSTTAYKNAKACLSKKHARESNYHEVSLKVGDSKISVSDNSEEDWADLVSGLASKGNQSDTWCAAFKGKPFDTAYSINASPGDPHSAILFRLLHLRNIQMESLPSECSSAIKSSGKQIDFSGCL